jgi:2,3-bisphosphoglycerate-dependent phosphoglycerate mutase
LAEESVTRLVLIRHGESQVTVDQIVGGHAGCTGLSPLGRKQAEALRDRLQRTGELAGASALYASVLPRAVETAEVIAPALGELAVVQECGVCEIHPGEADGLTWNEFRTRYGEHERADDEPWAPGSETRASFTARAGEALADLARRHEGETVVVACHGGVVIASFAVLGGLPLRLPFDLFVENTSLTEWVAAGDGRWRLDRYNDAAHLADL